MRPISRLLLFLWVLALPAPAAAQQATPQPPGVQITSPRGGEALQGQVTITGSTAVADFASAELAFAYTGDSTGTWFLIAEDIPPVADGPLAEWDTFAITDGDYDLRLRVTTTDGSQITVVMTGLRVRNYTAIETSTPSPTPTASLTPTVDLTRSFVPSATPTITPTPSPRPTATPLPPNPASLTVAAIANTLMRGAAAALAAFIVLGIYTSIRNSLRR